MDVYLSVIFTKQTKGKTKDQNKVLQEIFNKDVCVDAETGYRCFKSVDSHMVALQAKRMQGKLN